MSCSRQFRWTASSARTSPFATKSGPRTSILPPSTTPVPPNAPALPSSTSMPSSKRGGAREEWLGLLTRPRNLAAAGRASVPREQQQEAAGVHGNADEQECCSSTARHSYGVRAPSERVREPGGCPQQCQRGQAKGDFAVQEKPGESPRPQKSSRGPCRCRCCHPAAPRSRYTRAHSFKAAQTAAEHKTQNTAWKSNG